VNDLWALERRLRGLGVSAIAGVDEVGRGPLAGPVVAAAVILPPDFHHPEITDSKLLRAEKREELAVLIRSAAVAHAVAEVGEAEIDRINILQATLRAMGAALAALATRPDYVLVDGNRAPAILTPHETLVGGDRRAASIAAASIVAKVHRDRLMAVHHERWTAYNFRGNKGYGTAEHLRALREHGPCPIHRRSFRGVLQR
jgi:ribonuclease HII